MKPPGAYARLVSVELGVAGSVTDESGASIDVVAGESTDTVPLVRSGLVVGVDSNDPVGSLCEKPLDMAVG